MRALLHPDGVVSAEPGPPAPQRNTIHTLEITLSPGRTEGPPLKIVFTPFLRNVFSLVSLLAAKGDPTPLTLSILKGSTEALRFSNAHLPLRFYVLVPFVKVLKCAWMGGRKENEIKSPA